MRERRSGPPSWLTLLLFAVVVLLALLTWWPPSRPAREWSDADLRKDAGVAREAAENESKSPASAIPNDAARDEMGP